MLLIFETNSIIKSSKESSDLDLFKKIESVKE